MYWANTDLVIVWVSLAVMIVVGVILYFVFSPTKKLKRKFKKIPLKKITSCGRRKEPVRIKGQLEFFDPPLLSPLSKSSCAYFEFTVDEQRTQARGKQWREIVNHNNGVNFKIVDGNQKAIVQITFADVLLCKVESRTFGGFQSPISPELEKLIESYVHSGNGHRRLICKEGFLAQGEQVSVAGICERRKIKDPVTGELSEEIVFASDNSFKMIITDYPKLVGLRS